MWHVTPRDDALRERYTDILLEEPGDLALTGVVAIWIAPPTTQRRLQARVSAT